MMHWLISSFVFLKNYEQIWKIVGETRVQWVITFWQMSILCSTNGLSLLFAVFLGEKTIVLENPNGSFYKSLKLTYAYKLRAQFGCVKYKGTQKYHSK